ncbi:unnamed protein product [Cladocopium goreaui]|uniref:Uncharacterized protein n=1 Tax=Cladocopium goreaui TaxID=2562237 RepID=A0A9P1BWX0_9DINO|nr:unnamed protein product [Cladocopium goreaui]
MEEVRQLCLAEPWANPVKPASPSSEPSSEFQEGLRSFGAFRSRLQQGLALDMREAGTTPSKPRNPGRGSHMLRWLGMKLMESALPEQAPGLVDQSRGWASVKHVKLCHCCHCF